VWIVVYHPEAEMEYHALSAADRSAVDNAVRKLETYGPTLPYPHQSAVKGSDSIENFVREVVVAVFARSTDVSPTHSSSGRSVRRHK
jgi:hypothetical protein